jgi:cyclophilin family peptidyl-prolyl cis-trans isomerase
MQPHPAAIRSMQRFSARIAPAEWYHYRMQSAGLAASLLLALTAASAAPAQAHRAAPSAHAAAAEPTGPTAVFDTSAGRMICRLFTKEAPVTTANFITLVNGTKDWTDGAGVPQHAKPFYDATQVIGVSDGASMGNREIVGQGTAGPGTPPEKTGLGLDRAGRLVATVKDGTQNASAIVVLDHADLEYEKRAVVFGQCDDASAKVAGEIAHTLLSADNRPLHPIVLRRVVLVEPGQPLPDPAPPIPGESDLTIAPLPAPAVHAPDPTGPTAIIDTSLGTLTCRLFDKQAPIGVANFIALANGSKPFKNPRTGAEVRGKRFYDGLHFGRVIPDFMIQNNDKALDPEGGANIGFHFANEIAPGLTFDRPGRLAYANAGPDTNSSEFFITEHTMHRLDGSYTIFGQCDDASVKVVDAIARVPRDAKNKPLTPVVIRKITIEPTK